MIRHFAFLFIALAALAIGGCAAKPTVDRNGIGALAAQLRSLGPEVDPAEAERAARIAYEYSAQLAQEYEITDHPIIHNTKVNMGLRKRGLCVHWAEDMQKRLNQENFRTLTMHRAIAEPKNEFRIDHSTAVISRRGDSMYDGVVLDPWREGGRLFWSPTRADSRYDWRPQMEVLYEKYQRKQAQQPVRRGG